MRAKRLLFLLAMLQVSCTWGLVRNVDYRLPRAVTVPVGSSVTDAAKPFAETFCATLAHIDPSAK